MEQKCIIRNQLLVWQVLINTSLREKSSLCQGFPIVCALLGTRHHSRRWACGASSVFIAAPHCSHYRLSSASCQISGGIIYIILLNHLETTIPDTIYGKIVFPETGPWCQKVGDCCLTWQIPENKYSSILSLSLQGFLQSIIIYSF